MNLKHKLESWKQVGLLDTRQADAIFQYETGTEKSNFILYGFVGLGASVVILGLIGIIAANWDEISSTTKLITYFILQFGLGVAYLKISLSRSLLKEVCLYLFALTFFAGIGLIAQIFQLSGASWKPCAFWLLLNIGTIFLAQKRLLVHLWWIIFFITFPQALQDISDINFFKRFLELGLACISVAFLVMALGLSGKRLLPTLPPVFIDLALKYGLFALLFFVSITGTILWYGQSMTVNPSSIMLMYLAALLAFLSAYYHPLILNNHLKKVITGIFIVICLFNSLPIYLPSLSGKVGGAICFIILWMGVAWACALFPSKRLYNLATIIVMLRFIAIYLEVFSSLFSTGIGLVASGLFILLMAFIWHRYREVLQQWMQYEK